MRWVQQIIPIPYGDRAGDGQRERVGFAQYAHMDLYISTIWARLGPGNLNRAFDIFDAAVDDVANGG